jgi:SAM-dependent methyltransferase
MTTAFQPGRTLLRRGWDLLKGRWQAAEDRRRQTERWDREWIQYFNTGNPTSYFRPYTALTLAADLRGLGPREVYPVYLCPELPAPLRLFLPGSRLYGARLFEVGCGPAWLCKQLGLVADRVVGIDHSKLALRIARLVSPPTCSYFHSSRVRELRPLYGTFDCMACRFFFIHQNYASGLRVLGLARRLLRAGGLVGADFYLPDPAQEQGVVFPARSPLSEEYPSCAFYYTPQDVEELAAAAGFRVSETWDNLPTQQRFVLLERG